MDGTTAGGQGLTVNAGTGSVTFGNNVGKSTELASLAVTGPTTLNGDVDTDGPQTFTSTVTLAANTIKLNSNVNGTANGAIDFAAAISGGTDALVLSSGSGNQTLAGIASGNLTQTTSGSITLNTGTYTIGTSSYSFGAVTTNGTLTLGQAMSFGAVTLGSTTTIDSTNTAIDFTKTVDATAAGGQGLIVNAGTGAVTLGGVVGGSQALASLVVTGPTKLDADVSTEGNQTYNSAVTLGAATVTLNSNANTTGNGAIDFGGQITGGTDALALTSGTGNQTLSGITTTGALTQTTTGTVTLDTGTYTIGTTTTAFTTPVTTNGTLTLGQATNFDVVTLGSATTIDSTNTAIDFTKTVDATTAGSQSLTVNAGNTGAVTFTGAVGGSQALASLTVTGPTTLENNVSTDGVQTYNSAVTLGAALVTLNSNFNGTSNGAVDFVSTVDATTAGADGLSVTAGTGIVTFGSVVGGSQALASLAVTGPTILDGNVSTEGGQTFNSAVTLAATAVTLNSNANNTGNGAVDFASTVDATTAGIQGLTVTAGTGAVTFSDPVGGSQALASLAVTGPTTLSGNVSTDGAQTYNSPVTLGATVTLNSNVNGTANGAIDFVNTVDATGAGSQGLIVNAGTGAVTFTKAVGGSKALASLAATGPTALDGDVSTQGAQTYNSAVTLGAATVTLNSDANSLGNGAIDFGAQITGGTDSLALTSGSGNQTLSGLTTTGNLTQTTTGTVTLDTGTYTFGTTTTAFTTPVTTNGTLTLGQATTFAAVTLGSNTTIDSTNTAIDFTSTVDAAAAGAESLTVNAGSTGAVTFGDKVGGSQPLLTLAVTGPTTLDSNVSTDGAQTYHSAVTLGGALVTLNSNVNGTANGAVDFLSTVDATTAGDQGLIVNAGTGVVTFTKAVGGLQALASLAVTGPTALDANVSTQGNQTYSSTVTLGAASVTLNSDANSAGNGAIDFAAAISGGTDSLVLTSGSGNQTLNGITAGGLTQTTTGTITLDTGTYTIGTTPYTFGAVTTNGTLTLGQATSFGVVALGSNTTIDSTNTAIDFTNTVDGTTANAEGLVVNAGTGAVTFGAPVGGSFALTSLAVTGPTTLEANVTTDGAQTYNSAVTLGAAVVTLNSNFNGTSNGAVDFASTVDANTAGSDGLVVTAGTGLVTFGTTVGGSQALASLAVTGPTMLGGNVSTEGGQTYNSAVTLAATVTLNSNANNTGNGAIDFVNTVNATTAGSQGLTVTTGTGTVTFGGAVGGSQKLASLSATSGAIVLGGNVTTAGTLTLDSTGAATTLTLPVNLAGSSVTLDSAGAINQTAGTITAGSTVTLNSGATISQTAGVISAGTLFVTSTGGAALGDTNQVGDLGTSANTGAGGFTLQDGKALTVVGTVAGGTGTLSLTTTSGNSISIGSIGTVGALSAGTVSLTSGAGISEPDGSIDASTLTGSAAGTVSLLSTTNSIGALSGFAISGGGNLVLIDSTNLAVSGAVSANSLFLDVAQAGDTLSLGATAALTGSSGGKISLVADQITATTGASLTGAGAVELAPFSAGTPLTLGATGTGISVPPTLLGSINIGPGGTLVIGRVTPVSGFGTAEADGITIGASVTMGSSAAGTLDLESTGGVSEASSVALTVGTLTSIGGITGGAVTLAGASNAIGTLGGFAVTGNPFSLSDTGLLSVTGAVSASNVTIGGAAGSTPTGITVTGTGSIAAPTVTLSAGTSGIALNTGASLGQTGATVDLSSTRRDRRSRRRDHDGGDAAKQRWRQRRGSGPERDGERDPWPGQFRGDRGFVEPVGHRAADRQWGSVGERRDEQRDDRRGGREHAERDHAERPRQHRGARGDAGRRGRWNRAERGFDAGPERCDG